MKCGVLETNGAQNYRRWAEMLAEAPEATLNEGGRFTVSEDFFTSGGAAFHPLPCYQSLFQ
jgi:hypothetical protein